MFVVLVASTIGYAPVSIMNFVMIYLVFWIKMNRNLALIPTIQKLDRPFTVSGFAAHLKPNVFDGTNYKRWVHKLELWLISMSIWFITEGPSARPHTLKEDRAYQTADNLFRGAMISVLGENLVDAYMHIPSGKELWDALEAKFGVSDAGSELYVMEPFYDYRMVGGRPMLSNKLMSYKHSLRSMTTSSAICCKICGRWDHCQAASFPKELATSVKHKRHDFTMASLIGTLDVEEKTRAKDTHAHGNVGDSSIHVVHKKNSQSQKNKGKGKTESKHKVAQTTNFK
jgi:hypothetical protein